MDERIEKLADVLVNHSVKVKKGDNVLISGEAVANDLINAIMKRVLQAGGNPRLKITVTGAAYTFHKYASDSQLEFISDIDLYEAKHTDCFIRILGGENGRELAKIEAKKIANVLKARQKTKEIILEKRWVLCQYPTNSAAMDADMSLQEFENYVYSSSMVDWNEQKKYQAKIAKIFDAAKEVKLLSDDTDLTFSLRGRKGIQSQGECNIPDGEVFYAPIKESTTGHVKFSYPAVHRSGKVVDNIWFKFENGKVVDFDASQNKTLLKEVLNTDEGAKFIGEFGIGTNFNIQNYIKNILFDEKIGGTIHLAIGMAFKECDGTNESAVHWDILKDFRKSGEILADGKTVLKNGKWIFE